MLSYLQACVITRTCYVVNTLFYMCGVSFDTVYACHASSCYILRVPSHNLSSEYAHIMGTTRDRVETGIRFGLLHGEPPTIPLALTILRICDSTYVKAVPRQSSRAPELCQTSLFVAGRMVTSLLALVGWLSVSWFMGLCAHETR